MAIRIHDPLILTAQGALVDFTSLSRQRLGQASDKKGRGLFLRWQTSPAAGLPTEPFKVWRRPAMPLGEMMTADFERFSVPPFTTVLQFAQPLAVVQIRVSSSAGGTVLIGVLSGPPLLESIVTMQSRVLGAGGSALLQFQAPLITGLFLMNVSGIGDVTGLDVAALDKIDDWQLVETVGLPVDESDWAATGQAHGVKQGLVGAEMPAVDAAIDRYARGTNPLGWAPFLPGGEAAPPWDPPDPAGLVKECSVELLPMLRQVAVLPPQDQAARTFAFAIDPPQNEAGVKMAATNPGQAEVSPIGLMAMSAATDPPLAVVLGFGTGYADEDIPALKFGDFALFNDPNRSDWDWLVTGRWEKGLDGRSETVEFAALVPRPGLALPAPAAADLQVIFQAALRPFSVDGDWRASVRASFERFPLNQIAPVASFAAARHRTGTGAVADCLLEKRDMAGGWQTIGNVRNERDPEPTRQSATDGGLPIPNDPGALSMTYAVATQTIFGMWSPWVQGPVAVVQPDPSPVQILSADLVPTDPGSGSVCPAELVVDISIDWIARSPGRVELRGQLFAATTRSTSPPAAIAPAGVQRSLGDAAVPAIVTFAGDVASMAGAVVEAVDAGGEQVVAPGEATQGRARRFRVRIPGFTLDYAATPHVGLKLEARSIDRIAPFHNGPWSPTPRLVYASDPRARPTTVIDVVQLASLPDAAGEAHVHLTWNAVAGAAGYAVYEATETKMLASRPDLPKPTPDRTLSQRLTTLKEAFRADPSRRDFVRRNAELLTATAIDATIARGSRDIHLYTVLPVMAGGNEGPWPSGPAADAALIPYAAPRIAVPAPPTIEVQPQSDRAPAPPDHRARLRIGTRGAAGARPVRIDIHRVRVDDAARSLDTMGPPIASVTATGGGWTVATASEGAQSWIDTVVGVDRPAGSWRTVWYRAVAWSADDALRGVMKGRSPASPAASVLVPPAGPPDLSALSASWAGGDPFSVLVAFESDAPTLPTPVGPHMLSMEAVAADGTVLVRETVALNALATSAPVTGSGGWRSGAGEYRLLLRRAAPGAAVTVIVRLIDPLKRVTERVLTIAAGSIVPLPSLSEIDRFTIAGRGTILSFSTDAPDTDVGGGVYRIRVEIAPRTPAGPIPPLGRPPLGGTLRSQFRLIRGVWVFDAPIGDVPTTSGRAPFATGLHIARQAVPLDDNFAVSSTIAIRGALVRITTPDGRTVEQRSAG